VLALRYAVAGKAMRLALASFRVCELRKGEKL